MYKAFKAENGNVEILWGKFEEGRFLLQVTKADKRHLWEEGHFKKKVWLSFEAPNNLGHMIYCTREGSKKRSDRDSQYIRTMKRQAVVYSLPFPFPVGSGITNATNFKK